MGGLEKLDVRVQQTYSFPELFRQRIAVRVQIQQVALQTRDGGSPHCKAQRAPQQGAGLGGENGSGTLRRVRFGT